MMMDQRTLREGMAILAALDDAKFQGEIEQTGAYEDDPRDPTLAQYRVTLSRAGRSAGTLTGTVVEIVELLRLVVA